MVYHSVVLDVQKNISNCVLDIMEKDKNSHQLLIKLVCSGGHYYNISGYTPQLSFYDNVTKTTVLTTAIDVVNEYRGYMSYVVGERILMNHSRYTVTLRLFETIGGTAAKLSCSFILNVVKDPSCPGTCPPCPDIEVTISKEFYDELKNHLDNKIIHVSESDRAILSYLTDNLDTFVTHPEFDPVKQNVDNLNITTENLTTNVATMDINVRNLTSTVEALARQIESYNSQIKDLSDKVDGYDERIKTTENNVFILSTQMGTVTEKVTSIKDDVTALQTALNNKVDKVVGVKNDVMIFGDDGAIVDSGKVVGGATLASTPNANTVATEAAVKTALEDSALTWTVL